MRESGWKIYRVSSILNNSFYKDCQKGQSLFITINKITFDQLKNIPKIISLYH